MSDVIKFADWERLQSLIKEGNLYVSGLSASEAASALGAKANSGIYTYQAATAAGASNVINFPNAATAAEAAAEYVAGGGSVSGAGAATAATGAAENVANMTIIKGGAEGASGVAGLLAMPLPTAAAAIAPLAGVGLGVGLYKSNPDLWTKISKALLPFCYEDSELLPVTVDADGNTYYPNEAINSGAFSPTQSQGSAIVTSFNTSSICTDMSKLTGNYPDVYKRIIAFMRGVAVSGLSLVISFYGNSDYFAFFVDAVLFPSYDKTFLGSGIWDGWVNLHTAANIPITGYHFNNNGDYTKTEITTWNPSNPGRNLKIVNENYTNLNHNDAYIIATNYLTTSMPIGTDVWKGNAYPDTVTPMNILTGYDEVGKPIYTPYFPVTTPIGDPGISTDPSVNPDPAVNPNPAPVIEPYITPSPDPEQYPDSVPPSKPAPLPNPIPSAQPVPDPSADPSQETENAPDDPKSPKPPTDGGESGTTIIPSIPTLPSAANGLLHVYNPTQAQIDNFGSWLWTTFSGDLIDTLSKLFNDPMDAVIGLHELYATPSTQGDATIKAGYLDSGISAKLVGNRYTTINCGSVVVEEYYQNYLDYSPYTQVYIYLPFIGIVPVSADDIIGNAVNITYHVDSYTGSCIAVISVAKEGYSSTVYQFQGNCAVEIPISSGYQSSLMAGLLGIAGTAISGNPAVGLTAAHIGRAGLGKNAVSHSGSFGSSYGAMGCKIPYIIVRRPVQKKVTDYSKSYGYPAHKMVYIGNCKGYLRAKEVRVTSTKATNVEKEMIVSALKSGVYVK